MGHVTCMDDGRISAQTLLKWQADKRKSHAEIRRTSAKKHLEATDQGGNQM